LSLCIEASKIKEEKALADNSSSILCDKQIIDLYLQRSEDAINETEKQYGSYCRAIAMNILHNHEDAAEAVNDTYLNVWNAIPPQCPAKFSTFIGRITRNISLNKYKSQKTQKRGGNETTLLLSELENCVSSAQSVEDEVDGKILEEAIDSFLSSIKQEDMVYFVSRYWYTDSVAQIAQQFNVSEGKINMNLCRTRKKLKIYLEKRGITL
jgi:RNA polymerase sigma-70 factor (ECF subfamily)